MTASPPDGPFVWNVAGLLHGETGAERVYDVERATIELPDDLRLAQPVDGRVRLTRTNRGILAEADLRTALDMECVRCLRPVTVPLALQVTEEYLPLIDLPTGAPLPTEVEPDAPRLTDHHELDLTTAVREAISLAEPIAPLDRPDCPGLCIVCGQPLDEGVHDHPADDVDPRMEALRGFKPDGA
jgi:uncharacterized protein